MPDSVKIVAAVLMVMMALVRVMILALVIVWNRLGKPRAVVPKVHWFGTSAVGTALSAAGFCKHVWDAPHTIPIASSILDLVGGPLMAFGVVRLYRSIPKESVACC